MNDETQRLYSITVGRILRTAGQIHDLAERVAFFEALAERTAILADSNAEYLETLESDS